MEEIVGVMEDTRLQSPDVEPRPGIFIPFAQKPSPWLTWMTIVARVRSTGVDQLAIASEFRNALRELDASLPPPEIQTVEGVFRVNTARRTFAMTLVSGFAVIALTLVVAGLYGLITYSVARERREIGIRIALGARRWTIVGRVVRRSLALTVVGVACSPVRPHPASSRRCSTKYPLLMSRPMSSPEPWS
jgi:putative ABC transport system permease protein